MWPAIVARSAPARPRPRGAGRLAADNAPPGARSGRRRQAVTIKHVAADAGVSLQTVSRVINDDPKVSPHMKARVEASIEKLGYVPSIAAQRMSGSRSYIILALNDRDRTIADWMERQGVDWVDQMLLGGMLKCAELGYRMMIELVDTHSDHVQRELRATIAALQPDGVILTPPHSDNVLITPLAGGSSNPVCEDRFDRARARDPDDHGRRARGADGDRASGRAWPPADRVHQRLGRIFAQPVARRRLARGDGGRGPGHRRPARRRAISASRRAKPPRAICSGLPSRRPRSSPATTRWRSRRSKLRASSASAFPAICR